MKCKDGYVSHRKESTGIGESSVKKVVKSHWRSDLGKFQVCINNVHLIHVIFKIQNRLCICVSVRVTVGGEY